LLSRSGAGVKKRDVYVSVPGPKPNKKASATSVPVSPGMARDLSAFMNAVRRLEDNLYPANVKTISQHLADVVYCISMVESHRKQIPDLIDISAFPNKMSPRKVQSFIDDYLNAEHGNFVHTYRQTSGYENFEFYALDELMTIPLRVFEKLDDIIPAHMVSTKGTIKSMIQWANKHTSSIVKRYSGSNYKKRVIKNMKK
jgi:hypothetical protein